MAGVMEEQAVEALEALYAGPARARDLAQAREIFAFLRSNGQGKFLDEVPSVDDGASVLDVVALFDTITKRGGVRRVQEESLWKEVMAELGHPFDRQTLFAISVHYKNFLYAYEQAMLGTHDAGIPQQQQQQHQHPQKSQQAPPPTPPPQQKQQQAQLQQQQPPQQQLGPSSSRDEARGEGNPGGRAHHYEQYQRHFRQRELDQQQQVRQQRQIDQLQQQERSRKFQEQQRLMVKQQQQQQLQIEQQQLYQQQQQRQRAHQQMLAKQQQQQAQQHQHQQAMLQQHNQAPPYHSQQHRQSGYQRHGDGHQGGGNAFQYPHSRSRSNPPSDPGSTSAPVPRADLPKALCSDVPREVCAAVNTLTLETHKSSDELIVDDVPGLLDAVFDLMDKLNPAVTQVTSLAAKLSSRVPKGSESTQTLLDVAFAAADEPAGLHGNGAAGMAPSGRGELLLLLLNALRNASFVPSNERAIGHSVRAIQHFVSLCAAPSPDPAVFAATLDLFGRVTKHVDIWGKRAAETDLEGCKWAEDSLSYLAPAHVRMGTNSSTAVGSLMSPSALEYVSSAALLFPTLVSMVDDEERSRVLSALAILSKLAEMEENTEAFDRVPDDFLERLAELLSVPQAGCDVLAPKAGVSSPEWLEYNCRVMHPSVAGIDTEVRDSAVEVMSRLAALSDTLSSRLGAVPGCARTLTHMVIASSRGVRTDPQAREAAQARRMAVLTLKSLASVESNHDKIRPLYAEVLVAAASDSHAADLLFNGLKNVFPIAAA